jgi:hypothetical protein
MEVRRDNIKIDAAVVTRMSTVMIIHVYLEYTFC